MDSQPRSNPRTRLDWERYEAKIVSLYMEENKSLADVRMIMAKQDNFLASKSQYETRLKKWGLVKNHKGTEWRAIAYHLRMRHALGKPTEVFFKGRMVASDTVQRELARHVRGLSEGAAQALLPGFRLATPPPPKDVEELALPSEELLRATRLPSPPPPRGPEYVDPRALIRVGTISDMEPLPPVQNETIRVNRALIPTAILTTATTAPGVPSGFLKLAFAPALLSANLADASRQGAQLDVQEINPINSAYARFLIFSIVNNFVGTRDVSYKTVWSFLKAYASSAILSFIQIFPPVFKESLIRSLCQCAIEDDDAWAAKLFFTVPELRLDLDTTVHLDDFGQRRTSLELACLYRHKEIADSLLSFGANPNRSYASYDRGALACAIATLQLRTRESCIPNVEELLFLESPRQRMVGRKSSAAEHEGTCHLLELVRLLLRYGASVDPHIVDYTKLDCPTVLWELLQSGTEDDHRRYLENKQLLSYCLSMTDNAMALRVFRLLLSHPNALFWIPRPLFETDSWILPIVVEQGRVELLRFLLATDQFSLPKESLWTAVHNENSELIQFLIEYGADPHEMVDADRAGLEERRAYFEGLDLVPEVRSGPFTGLIETTAFAEAIRTRNPNIYGLFEQAEVWRQMVERNRSSIVNAALEASFEVGDFDLAQQLRSLNIPCTGKSLSLGLVAAIIANQTELALELISDGADVNSDGTRLFEGALSLSGAILRSPLECALYLKRDKVVRALLDHDLINVRKNSARLLYRAVQCGDPSLLRELLLAGISVTESCDECKSPLEAAILSKNKAVLDILMEYGGSAALDSAPQDQSPLVTAIRRADADVVSYMLASGADPGDSDALDAALLSGSEQFVRMILDSFQQRYPRGKGLFGLEAMRMAVRTGDEAILEQLLARNIRFRTLFWSEKDERQARIRTLSRLSTPLCDAIETEDKSGMAMMRMMLEGADREAIIARSRNFERTCETALLVAIGARQAAKIRVLVDTGADINRRTTKLIRRTPLQKAVEVGDFQIVDYLLNLGADFNAPAAAEHGATALQLACEAGFGGIVHRLLERGADPNAPGSRLGGTALEFAAGNGRIDTVKMLLHFGAGLGGEHHAQYEGAIELARERGHPSVVELLESCNSARRGLSQTGIEDNLGIDGESQSTILSSFMDQFVTWNEP